MANIDISQVNLNKDGVSFVSLMRTNNWPIVKNILGNLDNNDRANLASTCKQLNSLVDTFTPVYKMSQEDALLYYVSQNNIVKIHDIYSHLKKYLKNRHLKDLLELACIEASKTSLNIFKIIMGWLGEDIKNMDVIIQICKYASLDMIKCLEIYTSFSIIHDAVIACDCVNPDVCKYVYRWRKINGNNNTTDRDIDILLHIGWANMDELKKLDAKPSNAIIHRAINISLSTNNIDAIEWLSRYFTNEDWFMIYLRVRDITEMSQICERAYYLSRKNIRADIKSTHKSDIILHRCYKQLASYTNIYIDHLFRYSDKNKIMELTNFLSKNDIWKFANRYDRGDVMNEIFLMGDSNSREYKGESRESTKFDMRESREDTKFELTTQHIFDVDNFCDNSDIVKIWIDNFHRIISSKKTTWRVDVIKYRRNVIVKHGIEAWLKKVKNIVMCMKKYTSPSIFSLKSIITFSLHYDSTIIENYREILDAKMLLYVIKCSAKFQKKNLITRCSELLLKYYGTKEFTYKTDLY